MTDSLLDTCRIGNWEHVMSSHSQRRTLTWVEHRSHPGSHGTYWCSEISEVDTILYHPSFSPQGFSQPPPVTCQRTQLPMHLPVPPPAGISQRFWSRNSVCFIACFMCSHVQPWVLLETSGCEQRRFFCNVLSNKPKTFSYSHDIVPYPQPWACRFSTCKSQSRAHSKIILPTIILGHDGQSNPENPQMV